MNTGVREQFVGLPHRNRSIGVQTIAHQIRGVLNQPQCYDGDRPAFMCKRWVDGFRLLLLRARRNT